MGSVNFTEEQQKCIDTLDKSILVSAAAGSGKTAVLIERIINILIRGRASVDEMLVVTFTNAAASEMKVKATKAIKKSIRENPESREFLSEQLSNMYKAYISTFHSFALRIIREFFYKVDIDPDFKITDESQSELLKRDAIDELFEEAFEKDDLISGGSFTDFLKHYSSDRSEYQIKEGLLKNYEKLRSMPDYFKWADEKAEDLKLKDGKIESSPYYGKIAEYVMAQISCAEQQAEDVSIFLAETGLERMAKMVEADVTEIDKILVENGKVNNELFEKLKAIKWKVLRAKTDEKDAYAEISDDVKTARKKYKETIKGIIDNYGSPDFEQNFIDMDKTYTYAVYYIAILKQFEVKYQEKKSERKVIDFSDIEHITTKILDDKEVRETVKNRFKYIFIDEYQDTNYLQENLIGKISKDDNLFKVGDVKQSIYSFRQAEPQIFLDTYKKYENDETGRKMNINLNKNFRSNNKTLEYINDLFENIMDTYGENEKLYPGLPVHDEYNFMPEVHLLVNNGRTDNNEAPEMSINKREGEAAHAAGVIKDLIGTDFYDSKSGKTRKVEPKDIVVLFRNASRSADVYFKAMLDRGINAYVTNDGEYFDTIEINIAMSLLMILDNIKQDIPLISVLHSEIFHFSTSELGEIRAYSNRNAMKVPYIDAFVYYSENGENENLKNHVIETLSKINDWREKSGLMTLDDYIWYLLTDSKYYIYVAGMPGGQQRQANLRALVDKAITYGSTGISSLGDYIRYLKILKAKNVRTGKASIIGENDNVVRIMTIHKSKGLEFPFVIIGDMGGMLQTSKGTKGMDIDAKAGIGISYVDPDKRYWYSPVSQRLIHDRKIFEEKEEELRILYVAMTRAREKLIMIGIVKDEEIVNKQSSGSSSYFNILASNLKLCSNKLMIYDLEYDKHDKATDTINLFLEKRKNGIYNFDKKLYSEIDHRLAYEYPHMDALNTKAKYSVSELRAGESNEENDTKLFTTITTPEFRSDEDTVKATEIGTAYHRIMEFLDFRKAEQNGAEYIEKIAEDLVRKNAIEKKVYEKIDISKLASFFKSEISKRASEASVKGELKKEKPFTLEMEYNNQEILVQGIIDCFFCEENKLVLLDYKSNRIRPNISLKEEKERIREEYQTQMDIYKKALEEGTGMKVKEAYLYLFDIGEFVEII